MIGVIQRVIEARVKVGETIVGEIGAGLLALVSVVRDDDAKDVAWMAAKLTSLRIFRDADISETLQPVLFRQYEQELGKVLGDLYGRLNAMLVAHGFHATRRDEATPARQDARRETQTSDSYHPSGGSVPEQSINRAVANAGIDVFRVSAEARVEHQRLRDMLHAWRGDAQAELPEQPSQRAVAERRELRVQELVTVASLL